MLIAANCTQIRHWPIRNRFYCPDIHRYQVTRLIWPRYHAHLAEFGYGKYLIVLFWLARLVSPWVFRLDYVSQQYESWLDQTRMICHPSLPKRFRSGITSNGSIANCRLSTNFRRPETLANKVYIFKLCFNRTQVTLDDKSYQKT